jgi:hypothetical protein
MLKPALQIPGQLDSRSYEAIVQSFPSPKWTEQNWEIEKPHYQTSRSMENSTGS